MHQETATSRLSLLETTIQLAKFQVELDISKFEEKLKKIIKTHIISGAKNTSNPNFHDVTKRMNEK